MKCRKKTIVMEAMKLIRDQVEAGKVRAWCGGKIAVVVVFGVAVVVAVVVGGEFGGEFGIGG